MDLTALFCCRKIGVPNLPMSCPFCQNWVADLAKFYQIIMFHESLGRISLIQD